MPLSSDATGGQLTVDGVDLLTPAWYITDLAALWRPPTVTIINRRRTGQLGRKAYPPVYEETRVSPGFVIVGDCDQDGTPFDNSKIGLETNIAYLLENVILPVSPVRTATLTMPSGTTRVGPIQFEDMPTDGAYGGATLETKLSIVLPLGGLL